MASDRSSSSSHFHCSLTQNDEKIRLFFATRRALETEIRARYRYAEKFIPPADENLTLLEMCKYELLQEQALLNSPMATDHMLKNLPQIKADLREINRLIETRKMLLIQLKRSASLFTRIKHWFSTPENLKHNSTTAIQIKNVGEIMHSFQDEGSSTQSLTKTWELKTLNEANQPETSTIEITTSIVRQNLLPKEHNPTTDKKKKSRS